MSREKNLGLIFSAVIAAKCLLLLIGEEGRCCLHLSGNPFFILASR